MYLWLDTSHHVSVGLLDKDFHWIEHEEVASTKAATTVHDVIFQMLLKKNLKFSQLEGSIQIAGPGAYTGMRVSDGMYKFFKLQKMKTYAFYHYEVPKLIGVQKGIWCANAFKGEVFIFSWDQDSSQTELLKEHDFFEKYKHNSQVDFYTHHKTAFSPTFLANSQFQWKETHKMIHENSHNLFQIVTAAEMDQTLYYYRTNEVEFKKPT